MLLRNNSYVGSLKVAFLAFGKNDVELHSLTFSQGAVSFLTFDGPEVTEHVLHFLPIDAKKAEPFKVIEPNYRTTNVHVLHFLVSLCFGFEIERPSGTVLAAHWVYRGDILTSTKDRESVFS
jgi:hypothetical protein